MPAFCCVFKCGSRGERDLVSFFGIPTPLNYRFLTELNELSRIRRERWLAAINRKDLTETKLKYAKVCSKHFISGKPSHLKDKDNPDWVPGLNMGYHSGPQLKKPKDVERKQRLDARLQKKQKLREEIPATMVSEEPSTSKQLEESEDTSETNKLCQTDVTMKNLD